MCLCVCQEASVLDKLLIAVFSCISLIAVTALWLHFVRSESQLFSICMSKGAFPFCFFNEHLQTQTTQTTHSLQLSYISSSNICYQQGFHLTNAILVYWFFYVAVAGWLLCLFMRLLVDGRVDFSEIWWAMNREEPVKFLVPIQINGLNLCLRALLDH